METIDKWEKEYEIATRIKLIGRERSLFYICLEGSAVRIHLQHLLQHTSLYGRVEQGDHRQQGPEPLPLGRELEHGPRSGGQHGQQAKRASELAILHSEVQDLRHPPNSDPTWRQGKALHTW